MIQTKLSNLIKGKQYIKTECIRESTVKKCKQEGYNHIYQYITFLACSRILGHSILSTTRQTERKKGRRKKERPNGGELESKAPLKYCRA